MLARLKFELVHCVFLATLLFISLAACQERTSPQANQSDSDRVAVESCATKFVAKTHADPIAVGRMCGCFVASFPKDKEALLEAYLLDGTASEEMKNDADYWIMQGSQIQKCRFLGCAGAASVYEDCEFDAGYAADADGDFEVAIEHFSRFIAFKPDLLEPYINRGQAYLEAGHYDQAIADFKHVLHRLHNASHFMEIYRHIAMAYHSAGRDAEALPYADNDVALNRDYVLNYQAYGLRASIEENLGYRDKAIADYRQVLKNTLSVDELRSANEGLQRLGATPQ